MTQPWLSGSQLYSTSNESLLLRNHISLQLDSQFPRNSDTCPKYTLNPNISTRHTTYGELVKISVRDTIHGELIKTSVRGRQHAEEQSEYQCEEDNIGTISQNISTRETAQGEPIRMSLSLRTRKAIKTGFSQPGYHPPPLGRHNHLD